MNILVVDDNQDLAVNLADILKESEYMASVAYDGKTAIELCRSEQFDLVLLDYLLPDMDGLQLQEKLSELINADYLIITAHASIESAARAVYRRQIVGYETKPLDMDRLLAFIRQIDERRKAEEKIRQQDIHIKSALAEKEILLREIYHRTKNNMQVISSMISLQSAYIKDEQSRIMLKELKSKIHLMAMVHEKLYESKNLSMIDLGEYVKDIVRFLFQTYQLPHNNVTPRLELQSIPVIIDTAIPCGLILNELISNSFKHAFNHNVKQGQQGEFKIQLSVSNEKDIELIYEDNGPGVPDGFDFRTRKSLGLRTVFMLTEHQLRGTVELNGKNGLSCCIRFQNGHYMERV